MDDPEKSKAQTSKRNPATVKAYQERTHTLRLENEVWSTWQKLKSDSKTKTHSEFAMELLTCWEANLTMQSRPEDAQLKQQVTPMKPGQSEIPGPSGLSLTGTLLGPVSSTPLEQKQAIFPATEEVSDISEGEESNGEIMERYLKKVKETDTTFIEISLDFGEEPQDISYKPDSEEESDEEDLDLSDVEDFELEMSLLEKELLHVEEIEIEGAMERETSIGEEDEVDTESDTDTEEELMATEQDIVSERKFVGFQTNLEELARMTPIKTCQVRKCNSAVQVKSTFKGTAVQLHWVCSQGHRIRKWSSQPTVKRRMAGDFLLSVAVLTSGNNFEKIKLLFRFFGMGMVARTTHYQIQSRHSVPTINDMFNEMIASNREKYIDKEIVIAGDGRMDSPGHSAQYCTYTMLEYDTKDIVAMEIIDKRMTDLKSTSMEKEGMKRAISSIEASSIKVAEVVTDASTTNAAVLRKEYPQVKHSFDTWHGAKNIGKRLTSVAAERKNKDLRPWITDLINHFWYCSRAADGDESRLLSSWRGILHHVVNVHQWGLGDGASQAQCQHGKLDRGEEPKWLEPGGEAHQALTRVILDNGLLHSLKHYVNFRHTGELECFHEAILMYCAKRFAYTYPIYRSRNQLAGIDYQKHKDRPKLVAKSGETRLHRRWSKRSATWTAYEEKEPKKYEYIPGLHSKILRHFLLEDQPLTARVEMSPTDPRRIKRTIAAVSPPPTKQLFAEKKSRFEDK